LRIPVEELRQIEYPWRWRDARRGVRSRDPNLRLAFEALLDIGHYVEAYRLVDPKP
jgi:hypothetical protein